MASLEFRSRGGYRIVFRHNGKRYSKTLETRCEQTASLALAQLELNLTRLQLGKFIIKPGEELAAALLSNHPRQPKQERITRKPAARRTVRRKRKTKSIKSLSLGELLDKYLASVKEDAIESNTRQMLEIHVRHIKRLIGEHTSVRQIDNECLQRYVDTRSKEPGRRDKKVSPTTIRKEISTLATVWKWALGKKHVRQPLTKNRLQYAKVAQAPPFQTMRQIERRISRNNLTGAQQADLWDCLFLTLPEIDQLLTELKKTARHSFLYPLLSFAAHTGARRSEIIRSEIDDIDFDAMVITIREKKRIKGQYSTRSVPMTSYLSGVLQEWFQQHPGGRFTFVFSVDEDGIPRPLTRDQAADHFKRALADTKWNMVRGFHVFRHSFCSNAAAKGIDQRLINSWVGHQTEEMVRRYRHLLPNQDAIEAIFT